MTTATRSRIVYRIGCNTKYVDEADTRDEAEEKVKQHAKRTNQPVERYRIVPKLRKEGD